MEGYTNVIGSPYDFDDLDIEGNVNDEWNAEIDGKNSSKLGGSKLPDERTILSERVRLDNGQQANVFSFSKKNDHTWYTCYVCSDTMVGLASLRQHMETNKHRTNMSKPVHPSSKFAKLDPKENLDLEPGEPVPPGLEEVIIQNCLIQPKLDSWKSSPLIGLEFLVELTKCNFDDEIYYYCLLCEKNGSERNIFIHFTSIFHYMKYLCIYFPTVARKLHALPNRKLKKSFGLLVTEIIQDIEDRYGRMKPHCETHADFYAPGRKAELQKMVQAGPHVSEKEGNTFAEKATAENVDKKTKELQSAPPQTGRSEDLEKALLNKEPPTNVFIKNIRVNVDKKQLRPRESNRNSSPDIQIVETEISIVEDKKKHARSRSLSSISTLSSTSSQSRTRARPHRKQTQQSRFSRPYRNLSRSRSPNTRYQRSRSPSYSQRHSLRRSRDRSPRNWHHHRRVSRERSPDHNRRKAVDRYGRSREKNDSKSDYFPRERTRNERSPPKEVVNLEERRRWAKFREEVTEIESSKLEKLKHFEKNPEKHPQYPEEWKSFWNRRYNELQRSGVDPSKHDFKPEWISFWTKRMKELYEEDFNKAKEELKKKFDLPDDLPDNLDKAMPWKHSTRKRYDSSSGVNESPPSPTKKDAIADIKSTWKALTGSDIKDCPKRALSPWEEDGKPQDSNSHAKRDFKKHFQKERSQSPDNVTDKLLEDMPQRKTKTSSLIFVLRKLTVLEEQLGSLTPKVFELMSQSLALEKIQDDGSLDLLFVEDNCVFLETVREKLIALLCAGVVPRQMVNTARAAIKHIDIALYLSSKKKQSLPSKPARPSISLPVITQNYASNQFLVLPKPEPVVVPGVGHVDKLAIAQQIANALIEQGKTNVTEAELEQLINAVIGMAEASVNSTQPMTTANFLHQLQSMQNKISSEIPLATQLRSEVIKSRSPQLRSISTNSPNVAPHLQPQATLGALKLLQSAYNDPAKTEQDSPKREITETSDPSSSFQVSDKEFSNTLKQFQLLSEEEQPAFIKSLQTNNPEVYKKLCPFIPLSAQDCEPSKRSPISIPISKERSEQKMKPIAERRLSPFSSRSGSVNPAVGERIVIDDDEDDNDNKMLKEKNSESSSEPQKNKKILKYNSGDKSQLNSDDDDDYSFEDVYKAAHETLRKNKISEVEPSKPMVRNQEICIDVVQTVQSLSTQSVSSVMKGAQEESGNVAKDNKRFKSDDSKMGSLYQHINRSDNENHSKIPSNFTVPVPHTKMDTSTLKKDIQTNLQDANYDKDKQIDDNSFSQGNYHNKGQYSESFYSQSKTEPDNQYIIYPPNPPYSSEMESHKSLPEDFYCGGEQYKNLARNSQVGNMYQNHPTQEPRSLQSFQNPTRPHNPAESFQNPPRDQYYPESYQNYSRHTYGQEQQLNQPRSSFSAEPYQNPPEDRYHAPYRGQNHPYHAQVNPGYGNTAPYGEQYSYRDVNFMQNQNYPQVQARPPPRPF